MTSSTPRALLRAALCAKLATELGRAGGATRAAQHAGRLAVALVEELRPAREREARQQAAEDDLELDALLALRYPPPPTDDEPDGAS